jgi:hypothetical protein
MIKSVLLALLISGCAFFVQAVQIGDTAAAIKLETLAGDTFDLSAHAGKVVLIYTFGCT